MRGVNKVTIVGQLGKDPDCRYSQDGSAITTISVATNEEWKDKNNQKQTSTEWHRVVMFKRLAEIAGQYLKSGSKVYIEGKIKTRKFQDENQQDKYFTEIIASDMQMLDSKGEQSNIQQRPAQQQMMESVNKFDDQDIPF